MTEVWWCAADGTEHDYSCQYFHEGKVAEPPHESCGLRRLVPVDALVLVRDAEGNWPEWAQRAVAEWGTIDDGPLDGLFRRKAKRALDALAEAARDNPDAE